MRPKQVEMRLKTDPHALVWARVNEQMKHQPDFHKAYKCKAGDKLFLPENEARKLGRGCLPYGFKECVDVDNVPVSDTEIPTSDFTSASSCRNEETSPCKSSTILANTVMASSVDLASSPKPSRAPPSLLEGSFSRSFFFFVRRLSRENAPKLRSQEPRYGHSMSLS